MWFELDRLESDIYHREFGRSSVCKVIHRFNDSKPGPPSINNWRRRWDNTRSRYERVLFQIQETRVRLLFVENNTEITWILWQKADITVVVSWRSLRIYIFSSIVLPRCKFPEETSNRWLVSDKYFQRSLCHLTLIKTTWCVNEMSQWFVLIEKNFIYSQDSVIKYKSEKCQKKSLDSNRDMKGHQVIF